MIPRPLNTTAAFRRLAILSACTLAAATQAQLRVANWNVTNYSSGRVLAFQTAIYGIYNNLQFAPDVLIGEEFLSAASVTNFLSILNTAAGSPGDWAAAPFVDGPDTDSAFFYRTGKVQYLGMTVVALGSTSSTNQPRNTYRYDVRPMGYLGAGSTIAMYATHMKAGSTSTDNARRLVESQRIRANAETLPGGWNFLLGGDLNMQGSSQSSYQELVASKTNNSGRFFDPIATPGTWDNNSYFRFVHTQDPAVAMDSRYDFVLLGGGLVDGDGMDYIGDPTKPYSTSGWNDPNHSYRSWGNDGSSFNAVLNTTTNTMVGPAIAQALVTSANGLGHLPVFLDLRVPPRIGVSTDVIDFGIVDQFSYAGRTIEVTNTGDVALWGASGIADLRFTLGATSGFVVQAGLHSDAAGGGGASQPVLLDTSTPGIKEGTVTIASNATDSPTRTISVRGVVVGFWPGPKRRFQ